MARHCSICDHPASDRIDADVLRENGSEAQIAKRYGVSRSALRRHKQHLAGKNAACLMATEALVHGSVLAQIRYLQVHTIQLLEGCKDPNLKLRCVKEARSNLEFLSKLTGEMIERHEVRHDYSQLSQDDLKAKLTELTKDLDALPAEGVTVQ